MKTATTLTQCNGGDLHAYGWISKNGRTIPAGVKVTVLERPGNEAKIEYLGTYAWIPATQLNPIPPRSYAPGHWSNEQ